MTTSNELRVFISSTFRDLQEEREHLVKKIFPEIRALCRQRGVTFTEVDLRWGLTEEEASLGRTIRTCLEEVDKCRPYFIGIIGNRYGWVPELHDILTDPDLLAKYPFVEEQSVEGASVTEMEFMHGVFNAPDVDGRCALFYHRSGDLTASDDPDRLGSLIERARATGRRYREFADVDELGDLVRADLVAMIEATWPDAAPPSELELERRAHAAFAASRTRAYIPNPTYLKEFTTWTTSGDRPLVIVGESGLGKSSLVAYLVEYYRRKNPGSFVVAHYLGASQTSGTAISVMRHVVESIRDRFDIEDELPSTAEEYQKSFSNWLYRCEHLMVRDKISVLIVVDAVNQLDASGRLMNWLPETVPPGVKLVISTTPGDAAERLESRQWSELSVGPLDDARVRQSIVVRYLGEFHKGISPEQQRRLVGDDKARSPLYLRVVAEELRLHGEHESLDDVIERYTRAGDLMDVFDLVLERIERDYGEAVVGDLLSLIGSSRAGLIEEELLELTGMRRLELSRLLFALDYHLLHRDGLLSFFHDYLRRAVEKRYLSDAATRRAWHERLARYFAEQAPTLHTTLQLLHALEMLDERERLEQMIAEVPRFEVLWNGGERDTVLRLWSECDRERVADAYRSGLASWSAPQSFDVTRRLSVVTGVTQLHEVIGNWSEAEALQRERLELQRSTGDRLGESAVLSWLSSLARNQGRMDEAESLVRQAEAIARECGDGSHIARAVSNRGVVHKDRGEYEEALECYREQERIVRDLGDLGNIAAAIGARAVVYYEHGEYEKALECFRESEQITRSLGDRQNIAIAVGNRGNVHSAIGQHSEALECFREQERIARSLGDRPRIAMAVGNRGIAHWRLEELGEALECYREQEQIARGLGDLRNISGAVGNQGTLHFGRGEFSEALECYREQERIARELRNPRDIGIAVGNCGMVYSERAEYERALGCYRDALEEHRAIGFRYGLTYWLQGTAEVLLTLARAGGAMPEYLPGFVPDAEPDSWISPALRTARELAEECIVIGAELSQSEALSNATALLARIDERAADGDSSDSEPSHVAD